LREQLEKLKDKNIVLEMEALVQINTASSVSGKRTKSLAKAKLKENVFKPRVRAAV
jgi:hypothetical protein